WSSSLSEAPDGTYPPASSSAPASAQEDGSSPAAFSSSASGDADGTIEPRSGSSRSPKASSPSKERSPQPASRTPEAASTPASSAVLDVGAIGGKRIGGLSGSKGSARLCGQGPRRMYDTPHRSKTGGPPPPGRRGRAERGTGPRRRAGRLRARSAPLRGARRCGRDAAPGGEHRPFRGTPWRYRWGRAPRTAGGGR